MMSLSIYIGFISHSYEIIILRKVFVTLSFIIVISPKSHSGLLDPICNRATNVTVGSNPTFGCLLSMGYNFLIIISINYITEAVWEKRVMPWIIVGSNPTVIDKN